MLCRTLQKEYCAVVEKTKYGWTGRYVMHDSPQAYNMDVGDVTSEEGAIKEFSRFLIEVIQGDYDDYDYGYYDGDDDFYYD